LGIWRPNSLKFKTIFFSYGKCLTGKIKLTPNGISFSDDGNQKKATFKGMWHNHRLAKADSEGGKAT
jgi:hypothetical protein